MSVRQIRACACACSFTFANDGLITLPVFVNAGILLTTLPPLKRMKVGNCLLLVEVLILCSFANEVERPTFTFTHLKTSGSASSSDTAANIGMSCMHVSAHVV